MYVPSVSYKAIQADILIIWRDTKNMLTTKNT